MTDPVARPPIRTFHARRGRRSALTTARLTSVLPRYAVPHGLLAGNRPVVLEVGSGHGAAALAFAAAHPDVSLIALDVHPPGIARTVAAANDIGLGNLYVELTDAVEFLDQRVPSGRLAAVHLFFPDPWLRSRERRRRFVSPRTLDLLWDRLAPGGQVLVATDQRAYAAHVLRVTTEHAGFGVTHAERPHWRPIAGFEARGLAAGLPAIDLRLVRLG